MRRYVRTMMILTAGVALGVSGSAGFRTTFPSPAVAPAKTQTTIEAALDRPVPEVNLVDVPLTKAAAEVARLAGVRIEFDENLLLTPGSDYDRSVWIRGRNRPLGDLLDDLAKHGSPPFNESGLPAFDWAADGDRIVFAVRGSNVPGMTVTRVYDVRDVLARMEPALKLKLPPSATGGGIFFNAQAPESELTKLINDAVVRVPWDFSANENKPVKQLVGGRLIVTDTHSMHRDVRRLLGYLREPVANTASLPPRPGIHRWRGDLHRWAPHEPDAIEALMREPMPEFRTEAVPLRAAVQQWAAKAGVPVAFGVAAERHAELDRPIAGFGLRGAPAYAVLRAILDWGVRLNPGGLPPSDDDRPVLAWWYEGDTVVVGLNIDARFHATTRAYDLGGWFDALYPAAGATSPEDRRGVRETATQMLIKRVVSDVDPGSWERDGNIREFAGQLLVTQTPENQLAVERVIRDTRRARPAGAVPATGPANR